MPILSFFLEPYVYQISRIFPTTLAYFNNFFIVYPKVSFQGYSKIQKKKKEIEVGNIVTFHDQTKCKKSILISL